MINFEGEVLVIIKRMMRSTDLQCQRFIKWVWRERGSRT